MMKMFLSTLIISTSVSACPYFTGHYKKCRDLSEKNGRTFEARVSQRKVGSDYEFTWAVVKGRSFTSLASCTKKNMLASNTIGSLNVIGIEDGSFVHKSYSNAHKTNPVVIKCALP